MLCSQISREAKFQRGRKQPTSARTRESEAQTLEKKIERESARVRDSAPWRPACKCTTDPQEGEGGAEGAILRLSSERTLVRLPSQLTHYIKECF
jgi:hypothetical protein